MIKLKSKFGGAAVGLTAVVALSLAAAPIAAFAATGFQSYGYASCSSGYMPGSQALGYGAIHHEIGYNVAYAYGIKDDDLGSNPGYSRYRFDSSYASWAEISSPGGARLISTSWACRAPGW